VAQVVEYLPIKCEALSSTSSTAQTKEKKEIKFFLKEQANVPHNGYQGMPPTVIPSILSISFSSL
jgi:hypothetical protein